MMDTLFSDIPQIIDGINFSHLKNSLKMYRNENPCSVSDQELKKTCKTLDGVATMVNRYTYFHKAGNRSSLNTASKVVPDSLTTGPIILDATAGANEAHRLFGKCAEFISPTVKVRSYRNVTFYVCRDYQDVGKGSMKENAKTRTSNLMKHLSNTLDASSRVWVCAQKDVEKELIGIETPFKGFFTGHFGAIDGLNDWQECDVCVVFGLPHKPNTWALNSLLAHGAEPTDVFLHSDACKKRKKSLKLSSLVVDLTQIINRVRCRRVVDAEGNCARTDVYLLIPKGKEGDELIDGLLKEMPATQVKKWKVELDDDDTKRPKVTLYKERFLQFAKSISHNSPVPLGVFRQISGISRAQWGRIVQDLEDTSSLLSLELRDLGIRYFDNGKTKKANRKFLVKDLVTAD